MNKSNKMGIAEHVEVVKFEEMKGMVSPTLV